MKDAKPLDLAKINQISLMMRRQATTQLLFMKKR